MKTGCSTNLRAGGKTGLAGTFLSNGGYPESRLRDRDWVTIPRLKTSLHVSSVAASSAHQQFAVTGAKPKDAAKRTHFED